MKAVLLGIAVSAASLNANANRCEYQIESEMMRLENSRQDAINNLDLIEGLSYRLNLRYCDAGKAFLEVLQSTGSGATADTQVLFKSLARAASNENVRVQSLSAPAVRVIKAENSVKDAASTIDLATSIAKRQRVNSKQMLRAAAILTVNMGSGETANIQQTLRQVGSMTKYQGEAPRIARQIGELAKYENSSADVANVVKTVKQMVNRYEVRAAEAIESATEIVKIFGSGDTASSINAIKALAQIASVDRDYMSNYVSSLAQLHRLENSATDTAGNLTVIKKVVVNRKVSAGQAFDMFIRELRRYGSGGTAQARTSFIQKVNRYGRGDDGRRTRPPGYGRGDDRRGNDRGHRGNNNGRIRNTVH